MDKAAFCVDTSSFCLQHHSIKVMPELPTRTQVTDSKPLTLFVSQSCLCWQFLDTYRDAVFLQCSVYSMRLYMLYIFNSNMHFSVTPTLISPWLSLFVSLSFLVSWYRQLPWVVKIRWWDCHSNIKEWRAGYFWGCMVHSEELDDTDVSSRGTGPVHTALNKANPIIHDSFLWTWLKNGLWRIQLMLTHHHTRCSSTFCSRAPCQSSSREEGVLLIQLPHIDFQDRFPVGFVTPFLPVLLFSSPPAVSDRLCPILLFVFLLLLVITSLCLSAVLQM